MNSKIKIISLGALLLGLIGCLILLVYFVDRLLKSIMIQDVIMTITIYLIFIILIIVLINLILLPSPKNIVVKPPKNIDKKSPEKAPAVKVSQAPITQKIEKLDNGNSPETTDFTDNGLLDNIKTIIENRDFNDLNPKSYLAKLGYKTGRTSPLSASERQNILQQVYESTGVGICKEWGFPKSNVRLSKIIAHLNWCNDREYSDIRDYSISIEQRTQDIKWLKDNF